MKVVIQDVLNAKLVIDKNEIASINRGFVLFVGFTFGDDINIVDKMVNKILDLRIFMDENGKTNLSIKDINGEILSVSQFTLYADTSEGRRPSFTKALTPQIAKELYQQFNTMLEKQYKSIKTGIFGADMKVNLTNDGPFTIILDSEDFKK